MLNIFSLIAKNSFFLFLSSTVVAQGAIFPASLGRPACGVGTQLGNNSNINSGMIFTGCEPNSTINTYSGVNLSGGTLTLCGNFNISGNFNSGSIIIECGSNVTFTSGLTLNSNVRIENYGKVTINGSINFQNNNNCFYNEGTNSQLFVTGNIEYPQNSSQLAYFKNNGYAKISGTFNARNGGYTYLGSGSQLETNNFNYGNDCNVSANRFLTGGSAVLKYTGTAILYGTLTSSQDLNINKPSAQAVLQCQSAGWGSANGQVNAPLVTQPGTQICSFQPLCFTPLPVELFYFIAEKQDEGNFLTWKTASEYNNSHFNILRSRDGISWNAIGTVKGVGNSQKINVYEYLDDEVWTGVVYYRLEQTDIDGKQTLSDIITLNRSVTEVRIYPNPAKDFIHLTVDTKEMITFVELADATGKIIFSEEVASGISQHSITTNDFRDGLYFIRITESSGNVTQKVIHIRH